GLPEAGNHIAPVIVGMRRADHYLHILVHRPQPLDRLEPVPARRHAHVDERNGKRPPGADSVLGTLDPFLTLRGEFQYVMCALALRRGNIPEEQGLDVRQGRGGLRLRPPAEDLAEVPVNCRIVIDDEYPGFVRPPRLAHAVLLCGSISAAAMGSRTVKHAPRLRHSLRAVSSPPISVARIALACNPKPWPSFLVVKPNSNSRIMDSGLMPLPVSSTSIAKNPGGIGRSRTTSSFGPCPRSCSAWRALLSRLPRICRSLC